MAGANAINILTFSFNPGLIDSDANACAVPCEKPIYESDFCPVVDKM